jgi:hypothetical protein
MGQQKQLIGIAALVTGGVVTAAELERNEKLPGGDQWLAMAVAFFVVAALADLGIPIAGPLAVLTMVAVLLTRGDDAFRFVMGEQSRQRRARLRSSRPNRRRPGSSSSPNAPPGLAVPGVPTRPASFPSSPTLEPMDRINRLPTY